MSVIQKGRFSIPREIGERQLGLPLLYLTALILHASFFPFSTYPIAGVLSFISGTTWSILIPGFAILSVILPDEKPSLATVVLAGLALDMFIIHLSYLLALFAEVFVHPLVFMLVLHSILVLVLMRRAVSFDVPSLDDVRLCLHQQKMVVFLIIVGVALRLIVAAMASESIAPDACMYSNYARNLLTGNFETDVLQDARIYDLRNGMQYSFHQGYIYLASLSFVLVQPVISGPVPILILAGLALAGMVYNLGKNLFSDRAGTAAAAIILTHPTFVFHSSVAYGPEITSLLAILGCLVILTHRGPLHKMHYFMAGILLAIGDLIWYPNFLLFTAALPVFLYFVNRLTKRELVSVALISWSLLAMRIFFVYIDLYFISVFVTLATSAVVGSRRNQVSEYGFLAVAVIVTEAIWRGTIQLFSSTVGYYFQPQMLNSLAQAPNPQLAIFLREITSELIIKYVSFLTMHVTPVILVGSIAGLFLPKTRRNIAGCLSVLVVGSIGTLFLFASFSGFKEVLTMQYILSDSRFFLSLASVAIIAGSKALCDILEAIGSYVEQKDGLLPSWGSNKTQGVLLLIVSTCYLPLYISIPSGLGLINHETRFGWVGLPDIILRETEPDSIILTQRATEMAWLTGRTSASPRFRTGASLTSSLIALRALMQTRDASWFVMDAYTAASFKTLDEILRIPMAIGNSVPLGLQDLLDAENTVSCQSITLRAQTEPNINGDYTRLFHLENVTYSFDSSVNLLSSGWAASNGGHIENSSGVASLLIGENANYTNTWRPDGYDLGLTGSSSFILIDVQSQGASLARIEFYDETGTYYGKASSLGQGNYFFYIGSSTIGDIRFVIEGEPGNSLLVESIQVWGR